MAASKAIRYARHVRLAAWCRLNDSARRRNAHTGWPVGIVATRTSFLLLGHAYHRNQCSVMPGVAISGLCYHRDGKRASEFRGNFLKKSLDKLPNAGILTQVSQCIVRYVSLHDRYQCCEGAFAGEIFMCSQFKLHHKLRHASSYKDKLRNHQYSLEMYGNITILTIEYASCRSWLFLLIY